MRSVILILLVCGLLLACDDKRLYEKNLDFEHRAWMETHKPEFEFVIQDTTAAYNLYFNFRNTLDYPFSRLFFQYYLQDSLGLAFKKDLMTAMIFDPKTGKPFGSSGLGDIYDHQFSILKNHKFPYPGIHKIKFEQFMRIDTLDGVLAAGVRVERNLPD
jgi:gliding motility-associated lipoprotein GldH